ncbi:MAG: phosphate starvation-inducible protein PhoH [Halopenitus sp.]
MTSTRQQTDRPIGFLDPDDAFTRRFVESDFAESHLRRIDMYEFPDVDLTGVPGLIVSSQVDQDFLYRHRDRIRSFLEVGGVVAFSGHLARQWLPGAGCFEPKSIESHDDYTVVEATAHPVFEGVEMSDLTYQRGVAGFFARGHNPPPAHSTTVLRLRDGEPVVYVDDESTGGTIFVHSGNDLVGFGRRDTTAGSVPDQLVAWMRNVSTVQSTQASPPGDRS